jgi:hypothetical protein
MEIEENVNPGMEKRQFSKIPFENRQNMQSQIVVCQIGTVAVCIILVLVLSNNHC